MAKKEWVVKKDEGLPPYVARRIADEWQKQRQKLFHNQEVISWLLYSEWPDFLTEKEKILSPQELTLDTRRPLLRDIRYAVKVDMPTLWVKKEHLKDLLNFLRRDEDFLYEFLLDLTAVDYLNSPDPQDHEKNQGKRFQVWYLLRSLKKTGMKIRVILPVGEDESVPSITDLWVGANWPEREVFDLFGIIFDGHPDLRRILMPDNYRGHPLRKDFPIQGLGEDYLIEDLLKEHLEVD
ncbi:MAG: NADH-quinone oxidoreductase subunit C [Leptospiraceae bacterium]|nr:NADH-quinone oxidoreductase subunit C [Leptospiraceae bacterium]MDW8305658.1 NADH-quinone oxidoreductase subunit C [Leptospiraceae bacterium]